MSATSRDGQRAGVAGRTNSVIRALDGINRAIRDGCQIHGITMGPVATDGESVEIPVTTLGRAFTVVIVPGTLDAPDAPAILRPGDVFGGGGDGCGDEPMAYPVGHGFSVVGAEEDE